MNSIDISCTLSSAHVYRMCNKLAAPCQHGMPVALSQAQVSACSCPDMGCMACCPVPASAWCVAFLHRSGSVFTFEVLTPLLHLSSSPYGP